MRLVFSINKCFIIGILLIATKGKQHLYYKKQPPLASRDMGEASLVELAGGGVARVTTASRNFKNKIKFYTKSVKKIMYVKMHTRCTLAKGPSCVPMIIPQAPYQHPNFCGTVFFFFHFFSKLLSASALTKFLHKFSLLIFLTNCRGMRFIWVLKFFPQIWHYFYCLFLFGFMVCV